MTSKIFHIKKFEDLVYFPAMHIYSRIFKWPHLKKVMSDLQWYPWNLNLFNNMEDKVFFF